MSNISKTLRKFLNCREGESLKSNLQKRIIHFKRKFVIKRYSDSDFYNALISLGIQQGDNIIVHCSWREFYRYNSKPENIIKCLIKAVGQNGNIAMPAYGEDDNSFDYKNTKSSAGVLSEVFRTKFNTIRSNCSHFSMCVLGKKAEEITSEQVDSVTGFDEKSAYYKFSLLPNAKILFLGLGKYPLCITQIHIIEYANRLSLHSCSHLFDEKYQATLYNTPVDGQFTVKEMVKRKSGKPNKNNRNLIYKKSKSYKRVKLKNLNLVLINCSDAQNIIFEILKSGKMFSIFK